MYEFKAVASDGQWTIGYDADGLAGIVPGNMAESFEKASDFQRVSEGYEFVEGGGSVFVTENEEDSFGNNILFWNKVK